MADCALCFFMGGGADSDERSMSEGDGGAKEGGGGVDGGVAGSRILAGVCFVAVVVGVVGL